MNVITEPRGMTPILACLVFLIFTLVPFGSPAFAGNTEQSGDHPFYTISDPAEVEDGSFYDLNTAPQFQKATRSGEAQSNYEIDFIGLQQLYHGKQNSFLGDGGLIWWALFNQNIDGHSSSEAAERAGLLWGFNDGDAPDPEGLLGLFAWWQEFFQARLTTQLGKLYPGELYAMSKYYGDDRSSFMSSLIAGDQAGRYFENVGLGINLRYQPGDWFVQAGAIDAQAHEKLFDFKSLKKGRFMWALEMGYNPDRGDGETNITFMPYIIDSTEHLARESGLLFSFTHEFGPQAEYAAFGRYTFRDGGEGVAVEDRDEELPLRNGGFVGLAWNRPFGFARQQLSVALMYGSPAGFKRTDGFNDQYGVEAFWKFKPTDWLNIQPDIQLVRNKDDRLEFIPGVMFKLYKIW